MAEKVEELLLKFLAMSIEQREQMEALMAVMRQKVQPLSVDSKAAQPVQPVHEGLMGEFGAKTDVAQCSKGKSVADIDKYSVPSELNQSTECTDTHGPKAAQPEKSLAQSDTQRSVKAKRKSDKCRICGKFGHWARDCRRAKSNNVNDSKLVTIRPLLTTICVENVSEMTFEVDTGASYSTIALNSYYWLQNDFVIKGRKPICYQWHPIDFW